MYSTIEELRTVTGDCEVISSIRFANQFLFGIPKGGNYEAERKSMVIDLYKDSTITARSILKFFEFAEKENDDTKKRQMLTHIAEKDAVLLAALLAERKECHGNQPDRKCFLCKEPGHLFGPSCPLWDPNYKEKKAAKKESDAQAAAKKESDKIKANAAKAVPKAKLGKYDWRQEDYYGEDKSKDYFAYCATPNTATKYKLVVKDEINEKSTNCKYTIQTIKKYIIGKNDTNDQAPAAGPRQGPKSLIVTTADKVLVVDMNARTVIVDSSDEKKIITKTMTINENNPALAAGPGQCPVLRLSLIHI